MQMKLNVTLIPSSAGVKSMGATKVRKGERSTAKHTEEAAGAKTWGALKVPKARQISV